MVMLTKIKGDKCFALGFSMGRLQLFTVCRADREEGRILVFLCDTWYVEKVERCFEHADTPCLYVHKENVSFTLPIEFRSFLVKLYTS